MDNTFTKYDRKGQAEMRPVTVEDLEENSSGLMMVSVSSADVENGSPRIGDMIARNPKDHSDQWLVAEKYFKDNFKKHSWA